MRHDEILGLLHYLIARGEEPTLTWAGRWELAFWLLVLLITGILMWLRPLWIAKAEERFRNISQHRTACVWGIFAAVIVLRTALLPLIPVPVPVTHDEFSYLLGADTFASGRLTNPPHPMWVHFETFHVNMLPTYQSMYPPAQGLALALGQKLTGVPWVGVLLSVAAMCAIFCWMLQGWMAPQWALLGGIYAVLRYSIFSYWMNSYWGGAMAAIGGAMMLGALPRLRERLTLGQTVVFVGGLAILANSRPFEGFLFSLPFLCAALWALFRSPLAARERIVRIGLPALLMLGVVAGGMLYYNWRGTGNPLRMPYAVNQVTYHVSKPFLFQKPYPFPHYRHPEMRTFYVFHEYSDVVRSWSTWGLEYLMEQKFFCCYAFMVWPLLLLFVPGILLALRDPKWRVVALAVLLVMAGISIQMWPAHGHYIAPAAGAVLLIELYALQKIRNGGTQSWRPWFSRAVVLTLFLWMLVPISDRLWNPYSLENYVPFDRTNIPKDIERARIQAQLNGMPGQHLILVHYHVRDVPSVEWVYNRADIDKSKVVWARDMGSVANQELLRYYANRHVWYVDRNNAALLMPYSNAPSSANPVSVDSVK